MTAVERRRYFRILDEVKVALKPVMPIPTPQRLLQTAEQQKQVLEQQFNEVMTRVRADAADTARALEILNSKLNLLINLEIDQDRQGQLALVSLSACGMGLPATANDVDEWKLQPNDPIQLELTLLPSNTLIQAQARVVCLDQNQYLDQGDCDQFVRLNFEVMERDDQELLIQHLVSRQSQQLQKQMQEKLDAERSGLD